jgi:hypothetical protein
MLILRHWDCNFKTIFRWFTIGILSCDQVGSPYGLQPDEYTILVWTLILTNVAVGYDLRQYQPHTSTGLVGRPKVISSIYLNLYPQQHYVYTCLIPGSALDPILGPDLDESFQKDPIPRPGWSNHFLNPQCQDEMYMFKCSIPVLGGYLNIPASTGIESFLKFGKSILLVSVLFLNFHTSLVLLVWC